MRGLGGWLRAETRRFPWVVITSSLLGFAWVIFGGMAGAGDFGPTAVGRPFFSLITFSFVYGRGL